MVGPLMYLSLCEGIMIMLRGRNFKENIKMFGKVEKYRLKMVGPLMYLSLCEGRPPPRLICRLPDSCLATGGHCRSEAAVIISSSSRHHLVIISSSSSSYHHCITILISPYLYYKSSTRHGHTTSRH